MILTNLFELAVIAVSERFKDQVLMLEVPMRGVGPLLEAVKKLRSSSEHLTALYPDFFQLCLLVKCYKTGLSILEDDIFEPAKGFFSLLLLLGSELLLDLLYQLLLSIC